VNSAKTYERKKYSRSTFATEGGETEKSKQTTTNHRKLSRRGTEGETKVLRATTNNEKVHRATNERENLTRREER